MATHPIVDTKPETKRPRGISRATVLVVGVILIPLVLGLAFNSYGALTIDGALRMAFATVAGQTIAILSAITALILTIKRRYAWPAIVSFAIITAVITLWAFGSMASAGDTLLDRLDVIAEVNQLNNQ